MQVGLHLPLGPVARSGAAFALLSLGLSAHADTLDDIKKAGKIRIAIDTRDPALRHDRRQDAADRLGHRHSPSCWQRISASQLEIVTTTGPTRIPVPQTNKADLVVSTLSITPDRAKVIDFSIPYADHPSVVGGLTSMAISSYADLAGKKVAVVRGTTQDTDLTPRGQGGAARALRGRRHHGARFRLGPGRHPGDGTLAAAGDQQEEPRRAPPSRTSRCRPTTSRSVCARTSPRCKAWVNDWVKANLQNGKLGAIYKKWHGVDIPVDQLLKIQAGDSSRRTADLRPAQGSCGTGCLAPA